MGRKPFRTPDEKLAVVLSVLKGESTQVEVARRLEMSQTTIAKWQKQFLEGGRESLARGDNAQTLAWRRETSSRGAKPIRSRKRPEFLTRNKGAGNFRLT